MSYFHIHVSNLLTDKGNPAANQFMINVYGKAFFQSYNTTIAKVEYIASSTIVTLDNHWKYSRTTLKYLKKFLHYHMWQEFDTKKIERYIKEGLFKTDDLNDLPF